MKRDILFLGWRKGVFSQEIGQSNYVLNAEFVGRSRWFLPWFCPRPYLTLSGKARSRSKNQHFLTLHVRHCALQPTIPLVNKTLCERVFGRGRTTGMILWTCLIAAKELSSYLTREDKSFTPLVCWTTQLIQYVPIHNKNYSVISWQCLKICTSPMQTCLEPNCNIGHKWLQPGE